MQAPKRADHLAPYLNEPVLTDRQQEAYETIVSFLDKVDFDIPADLRKCLDEITLTLDESFMENVVHSISAAIHETEKYLDKALRQFNSASGYNDIFIPAMCQLSESYQKYHEELLAANFFRQVSPGYTPDFRLFAVRPMKFLVENQES